ncbi:hypothetical protein AYX19_08365 [Paenarthrobacter ureafaciens]|nr:hypothetical protein AYX19_08365 [Paenarthrobacter ureafaciens]
MHLGEEDKRDMSVTRGRSGSAKSKTHAANQAFTLGSSVKVPFGKRTFDAKVIECHKDRVTVEINIEGASDPLITSYRSDEVTST